MEPKPLYKQIKMIPFIFLLLVMGGTVISLYATVNSVDRTTILNVSVRGLKERTVKHVTIGENSFSTGYEGKLYWKVKSIKEAFLISLGEKDNPVNFYDLFYFLVLDIILFIMVYRVDENTVFSNQITMGFQLIGYSIIGYPFILLAGNHIAELSIKELTQGQFTSQYRNFGVMKYLYISYLFLFFVPLIKKAINLQKDQDLTI